MTWKSSQVRTILPAILLTALAVVGVIGWSDIFVRTAEWGSIDLSGRALLGLQAAVAALGILLVVGVALVLIHRLLFSARGLVVEPDKIVLIGPFGARFPWHSLARPAAATVKRKRGSIGDTSMVVVRSENGRTGVAARDLHWRDAEFIAAHMGRPSH